MKGIICDILIPPPPHVQSSYSRTMGNYMVFTAVAMRRHKFRDYQPQTQLKVNYSQNGYQDYNNCHKDNYYSDKNNYNNLTNHTNDRHHSSYTITATLLLQPQRELYTDNTPVHNNHHYSHVFRAQRPKLIAA